MPSETLAQHEAMEAAAHGKSRLGIPRKVGKEYTQADTKAKVAALRRKQAVQKEDDYE